MSKKFHFHINHNNFRYNLIMKHVYISIFILLISLQVNAKEINPLVLRFTYPPNESPFLYKEIWKDFTVHLSKTTNKKVEFFPYQTNKAQLKAMNENYLHIAGFNTGMVITANKCANFEPLYVLGNNDGTFGYKMQVITYKNSTIKKISDIKNETILFTSPSSNSGYKAPLYILKKDFNLLKNRDFNIKISGNHNKSINLIKNKKYKVAAIASSVKDRMINRNIIEKDDLIILYSSETFPTTAYGYNKNLSYELKENIKKAFDTFVWIDDKGNKSSLKKGFPNRDKFIAIDYKKDWKKLQEIDLANNVTYTCK